MDAVSARSYTWNGLDGLPQALQKLQATVANAPRLHSSASPSVSGNAEQQQAVGQAQDGGGAAAPAAGGVPAPAAGADAWNFGGFQMQGGQFQQPGAAAAVTPTKAGTSSGGSMLAGGFGSPGGLTGGETNGGAASDGGRVRYARKDKSLGLLSQRFIQMFLASRSPVIALDDAATALLGALLFWYLRSSASASQQRGLCQRGAEPSASQFFSNTACPLRRIVSSVCLQRCPASARAASSASGNILHACRHAVSTTP